MTKFIPSLAACASVCSPGDIRHKAIVSLTLTAWPTLDGRQQGSLTIVRPKIFGGKLRIPLNQCSSLLPVSGKEARCYKFGICYGRSNRRVMLRAPTQAIYETWWRALENAFTVPRFAIIDAPVHHVTLAPVLPARPNAKASTTLDTVPEVDRESHSIDEVPILEAGGPSSVTELDILASWRTWGSLDYFATPPSNTSSLTVHEVSAGDDVENNACATDDASDRISVYSDISTFWSRPSELDNEIPQGNRATAVNYSAREQELRTYQHRVDPEPQDDEEWLDEIALFAFRHKVEAVRQSEQRPKRSNAKHHPMLKYSLLEQRQMRKAGVF
ncbi:hypothetical protein ON010_g2794 [Phytophthora cinnamomi]|nr:hypothetical protein ON010_g2794 [Phytophthora cinnamomi]